MLLGACLDAGVPLDDLRAALGSLGLDDYTVSSERVLRSGISATRWRLDERVPAGAVPPQEGEDGHPHRHVAQIERLIARSALAPAARRARHRPGSPAGGHRGGDPSDAGRGRAPARSRCPRLDPRHRRRRVRARVVPRRTDRRVAAEPGERHGPLRARHPAGAGAGDRAADAGRSGLSGRTCGRADDADRRAARDRLGDGVRADAGDARRADRLRRRPPRLPGSAERAPRSWSAKPRRPRRSRRASGSR